MKKVALVVFGMCLLCRSALLAQPNEEIQNPCMDEHAKALLFGLDKDLYLDSFLGTLISAKRHLSASTALRYGVSVGASIDEWADESRDYDHQSKNIDARYSFSLNVDYMKYFPARRRLYFFGAFGPSLSFARSNRKSWFGDFGASELRSETASNEWGVGFHGAIGVEWFVADNISLSAEYGASAYYSLENSKHVRKSDNDRTSTQKSSRFSVQPNTKKLGISFYFGGDKK